MRNLILLLTGTWLLCFSTCLAGDSAPVRGAVQHEVSSVDTLASVAKLYGVSPERLKQTNDFDQLVVGQILWVPPAKSGWPLHSVQRGQTLWRIGKGYGIPIEQIQQANSMADNRILPGNILVLPRAVRPEWTLPEVAAPAATVVEKTPEPSFGRASLSSRGASPVKTALSPKAAESLGQWVEVRLADNRRAWVKSASLVLGSWQPQDREFVIQTARRFEGVPYHWGGTNPNGYDCSGFVQEVFRLAGHEVPRLADHQFEQLEQIEQSDLMAGDLVFFNTDGQGVSHVGIYVEDGRFIHASSSRGVVEDELSRDYFRTRYVGAARISSWK